MGTTELSRQLDQIEAEMERVGMLSVPAPASLQVTTAFGYGEMAFEQWLVHIFLPNARAGVASGQLPANSQVATAAMRNFDGDEELDPLVSLLSEFDQAIRNRAHLSAGPRGLVASLFAKLRGKT